MKTRKNVVHNVVRYRYQRIFTSIMMTFALVFALCASGYIFFHSVQTEYTYNQGVIENNAASFETMYSIACQSVSNIRTSSSASAWAAAKTESTERLEGVHLLAEIKKQVTWLNSYSYSIGAWKIGATVTQCYMNSASTDDIDFFSAQFGVEQMEDWISIVEQVRSYGTYFLPAVGTQNEESLICLFYNRHTSGEAIYFLLLPITSVDGNWALVWNGTVISTNMDEDSEGDYAMLQKTLAEGTDQGGVLRHWTSHVYRVDVADGQLQYYWFPEDTMAQQFLTLAASFLILMGVFSVGMFLLTQRIYRPVRSFMQELEIENPQGEIDEFAMLRNNVIQLKLLNRKMEEMLENHRIQSQEDLYVRLLSGSTVSKKTVEYDSVCVVVFAVDEEMDDDSRFLLKNDIRIFAKQYGLIFVSMPQERWVMIFQDRDVDWVEQTVRQLFSEIMEDRNVTAAISEAKTGQMALRQAYKQAGSLLRIQELRPDEEILRADRMKITTQESYYYPVTTENQLIHWTLEGDSAALDLFDECVRDNLQGRKIAIQQVEGFILALVSTINRIYSQMGTEKAFERPVSGAEVLALYDAEGEQEAVSLLRNEIQKMIEAVASQRTQGDTALMNRMLSFIHDHYMYDIGLADIAQEMGITPQRCSLVFKQLTNENFKNYLNGYRVKMAQQLQREDPDITTNELAQLVGFNSANSFIRVYKKYTGISPQNYIPK
ncbi:MAG: helix-turn-helix domain-containing protein [Lachnospiraceae bacterium]|nr:helix-turn-helix domain-containing protein [Lachnospiraceae bacterium]